MLHLTDLTESKAGYDLALRVNDFVNSLVAIFELNEKLSGTLEDERPEPDVNVVRAFEELNDAQQEAVSQAFQLMFIAWEGEEADTTSISSLLAYRGPESGQAGIEFYDLAASEVFQAIIRRSLRGSTGESRARLLRRSLVTTAVASFEHLVETLVEHVLTSIPEILNRSEHTFTLRDLENFDTVEDARTELKEKKISSVVSDGIEGWIEWFAKRDVGVDFTTLTEDWVHAREFFARRNLLTHKDGIVDKKYLDIVRGFTNEPPKIGVRAFVGSDYLRRGIVALIGLGAVAAFKLWVKLHPKETPLAQGWIVDLQEEFVELGFWRAAINVRINIAEEDFVNRELLCRSSIHRWTAMKLGDIDVDEMLAEVAEWDTTGLDELYAHTKWLFLGEDDKASESLQRLYKSARLGPAKMMTNPLYRGRKSSHTE